VLSTFLEELHKVDTDLWAQMCGLKKHMVPFPDGTKRWDGAYEKEIK
jgi:hypothetical protein